MNYQELEKKDLTNNLYVLVGDGYLCGQAKMAIINKLGLAEINISEFNDENFDMLAIVNACNQFSFFNEKRAVVIKDVQKELTQSEKNMLIEYSKTPNKECYLIVIDGYSKFEFLKNVEVVECKAGEMFLQDFIKTEFEKNNKNIGFTEVKKLITNTLGNLNRITIEIKKICDYLGAREHVTSEDVDLIVSKDTELKVFDLTVALSTKDKERSHKLLFDMLKAGEPPIKILGLISGHFRRMFFAKINKGKDSDLAKMLGCKEFAVTKAREQALKFSAKELKDIENLILETDYAIKSGEMTQENALYYLIFKIVG